MEILLHILEVIIAGRLVSDVPRFKYSQNAGSQHQPTSNRREFFAHTHNHIVDSGTLFRIVDILAAGQSIIMVWSLVEKVRSKMSHVLTSIICSRETPNHIGFIMDGNRRYAHSLGIDTMGGHSEGYRVLLDCLQWCLELQVSVVSVYAFSIDNFNRSDKEVDALMRLAHSKILELCRQVKSLERRGVRIQIVGDLSLAPKEVQEAAQQIMTATECNSRCTLNICFSYTYVYGTIF